MNGASRFGRCARRLLAGACAGTWSAAFWTSHIPVGRLPSKMPPDAVLHFSGFLVLAGAFAATLDAYGARRQRRWLIVFLTMSVYAALDEMTQPIVNRSCDVRDWLADVAGALAAVLLYETCRSLLAAIRRRGN